MVLLSHDATGCLSALVGVKPTRYSALVTQDDDWPARVARLVAREVRRYRERQRPKMSAQQLADRTAELGMPIPRSVLANLESGRRETVSAAEVIVLAAALNVAPIELICPAGFDQQIEMLPGRTIDPLSAMRWYTGELKLETDGAATTLRQAARDEQSSTYLVEYHEELINRLRSREGEVARAIADVHEASAKEAAASKDAAAITAAVQAGNEDAAAVAKEVDAAEAAATYERARAAAEVQFRSANLAEWREFIREPLRQTRMEMRRRGMLLPDLPADLHLDLDEDDR
jgi:transcriptional regulator with XRE-family HTH domain